MSVKLLVDMNLSVEWVDELAKYEIQAVHWSSVGNPRAADREILDWARANGYIVFTHDLDFGTTLALTHESGPSVVQIRSRNVLPEHLASTVVSTLQQHEELLNKGALVVVEESRSRVRILPL